MDAAKIELLKRQFHAMGSPPEMAESLRRAFERHGMPQAMQDEVFTALGVKSVIDTQPPQTQELPEDLAQLRRQLQEIRDQAAASGINAEPLIQAQITVLREGFTEAGISQSEQDQLLADVGAGELAEQERVFSATRERLVAWFHNLVATSPTLVEAVAKAKAEINAFTDDAAPKNGLLMLVADEVYKMAEADTSNPLAAAAVVEKLGLSLDNPKPPLWKRLFGRAAR